MKILFCNIAYMNQYIGNVEDDVPQGGGAWVEANKDAHEKWNFLNVDGKCYGFAMNKGNEFHIERINGVSKQQVYAENVTVVWCAHKPTDDTVDGDTVIVGWYENATVYRSYQNSIVTPFGLDRAYFVQADADDCYLLPESKRSYTIGRASVDGKGKGFGQSNIWYADSDYAKDNIIPEVLEYIQNNKMLRTNRTNAAFLSPVDIDVPLSERETALANEYYDGNEYMKYLPLGFRAFTANPTADNAYFLAVSFKELRQYSTAITWFNKVIEIEGDSWDAVSNLPYLLMECGRFEEAFEVAMKLLSYDQAKDADVKFEIYGVLADSSMYQGKYDETVSWLDKIIEGSNNKELVEYTKEARDDLLKYLSEIQ